MQVSKIHSMFVSVICCLLLATSAKADGSLGKRIKTVHDKVKALEPVVAENTERTIDNRVDIQDIKSDIRGIENSLSPNSDSNLELQLRLFNLEARTAVNSFILRSILENPSNFDADELLEKINGATGDDPGHTFLDVGENL